jgi:hypothetical protein
MMAGLREGRGKEEHTSFRFLSLNDSALSIKAEPGAKIDLEGKCVRITLGNEDGDALLEIYPGPDGVEVPRVHIDGVEVFDVAHFHAGEILSIGAESFVLLAPFAALVRGDCD